MREGACALSFLEDLLICHFPEEWPIKFTTNVGSALSWFFAWDIVVIFTLSTVQWLRSRIPTIYLTVEENGGSDTLTGGNGGGYTLRA